jgi:hypothetical protein
MIAIQRNQYILLLSNCPCEVFDYFGVTEMHGLNLRDCIQYNNTNQDAYIAGLCNYIPKKSGIYENDDPRFVYINLSRCTDDFNTALLLHHELMHCSFALHQWDVNKEEEIITWADLESVEVFKIIKPIKTGG